MSARARTPLVALLSAAGLSAAAGLTVWGLPQTSPAAATTTADASAHAAAHAAGTAPAPAGTKHTHATKGAAGMKGMPGMKAMPGTGTPGTPGTKRAAATKSGAAATNAMPGTAGMAGMAGMGAGAVQVRAGRYGYLLYRLSERMHIPGAMADAGMQMAHKDSCMDQPPTAAQIRWADDLAVRTAKSVEKMPVFANKAAALAWFGTHGYTAFDLGVLSDTTGLHVIDWKASIAGHLLDPDHPQVYLYIQTKQGYRPYGAMFTAGGDTVPKDAGGCFTHWHRHAGAEALGWMQHVFTYGAPNGPFADPDCGLRTAQCVSAVANRLHNPTVG